MHALMDTREHTGDVLFTFEGEETTERAHRCAGGLVGDCARAFLRRAGSRTRRLRHAL